MPMKNKITFLGVEMDIKLKFGFQVKTFCSRINRKINALWFILYVRLFRDTNHRAYATLICLFCGKAVNDEINRKQKHL